LLGHIAPRGDVRGRQVPDGPIDQPQAHVCPAGPKHLLGQGAAEQFVKPVTEAGRAAREIETQRVQVEVTVAAPHRVPVDDTRHGPGAVDQHVLRVEVEM
jgi:hypothetical protein